MKNIIVVSGASSGFGALAARALARAGHSVYASMRETTSRNAPQVKEMEEYATAHDVDLHTIELDVLSQESTDAALKNIISENGRLDVVIHNAGHMVFGPAEAIVKVVDMPFGKRPFRIHIDPAQDGCEVVNAVADRIRAEFLRRIGLGDLLAPRVND